MKKLQDEVKACRVIECLVSDDLFESLEFDVCVKERYDITPDKLKALVNKLGTIYELSHVANKPSCIASHKDWSDKLDRLYIYFRRKGYIKPYTKKGNK
jgi:hypothetical protein